MITTVTPPPQRDPRYRYRLVVTQSAGGELEAVAFDKDQLLNLNLQLEALGTTFISLAREDTPSPRRT